MTYKSDVMILYDVEIYVCSGANMYVCQNRASLILLNYNKS